MTVSIAFTGSQTIANVEEAHARLRDALMEAWDIQIDVSAVTEADLAFVQLLLAARRSVEAGAGTLTWRDASDAVVRVIARAGLGAAHLLEPITGEQQ